MSRLRSRLRVESLEQRRLLAVNVFSEGNTVFVVGDNGNDAVEVSQEDGELVVRGTGNTQVSNDGGTAIRRNGRVELDLADVEDENGRFNIVIDLNGGNDRATVRDIEHDDDEGPQLGNLSVVLGAGTDSAGIRHIDADNISVDTDGGTGTVALEDVQARARIGLVTGGGTDTVTLNGVEIGAEDEDEDGDERTAEEREEDFQLFLADIGAVNPDDAFDRVLDDADPFPNVGGAEIELTAGLAVVTGGGNDRVTLDEVEVGPEPEDDEETTDGFSTFIDTDGGTDRVTLRESFFAGLVDIALGAGNDTLDLRDNEFFGEIAFDGGTGTGDSLTAIDNEFAIVDGETGSDENENADRELRTLALASGFERTTIRDNEFRELDDDDDDDDD